MIIDHRETLTRRGDISLPACSMRMRAAREAAKMSQKELADALKIGPNAINNMEKERQRPNWEVMRYFYRAHRIDFNFMMHGDFAQLPGDVQSALFDVLEAHAQDQKPD